MTPPARPFPLAWPPGKPRTTVRRVGKFSYKAETKNGWQATKDITISRAMERLTEELGRLGARDPLLSSNLPRRLDGGVKGDAGNPVDPGVCLYFTLKGKPMVMACDTFGHVAQNIAALAAHIEATRAIERYGVASAAEALQAFEALPSPSVVALSDRKPWRHVLGFEDSFPSGLAPEEAGMCVQRRWKARQIEAATDAERMDLNVARDAALKELQ